jgi:signal transduction histidine kinase
MFFWEVVKKTEGFRQATDDLAAGFTTATKAVGEQATIQQLSLLRRMQHLVETKKSLFAKVAELRPEFGWATSVLNKETETGRFQEFNLLPVVGQAMSEASREFDAYPVIEHNHLGYTIPIVFGSEAQIRQVITELIRNAMLHSGGSAPITVSITQTEMDYRVAVRDEGQGIPNEYVPRLTEPGYKVPGTSGGGAGNGLSLVKRILTAHKARLLISSEPREGSAFTVCLPAVTRPSTFRASG